MSRRNFPYAVKDIIKNRVHQVKAVASCATDSSGRPPLSLLSFQSTSTMSTISTSGSCYDETMKKKSREIEENCNGNYRRTSITENQHSDFKHYRELAFKHTKLCEDYVNLLTEIADLKARLKNERRRRKKETSVLRGRIQVLKEDQEKKASDYNSSETMSTVSSQVPSLASENSTFYNEGWSGFQEMPHDGSEQDCDGSKRTPLRWGERGASCRYSVKHDNTEEKSGSSSTERYENRSNDDNDRLVSEILDLKLQLAKAHSEADHRNLKLNRVTLEFDKLRSQQAYSCNRRRLRSRRGTLSYNNVERTPNTKIKLET